MPIKLRSAEYKIIAIAVLVAAVSLGIGVKYFWRAFPEAAIEFRVTRADSEPIARTFLEKRGAKLQEYEHAAIFEFDDDAKLYLERTQGLERMNQLTRGPIHLWRWTHRWFRPQQKEEYRCNVTPAGQVVGYEHEIPEAATGANLELPQARQIAETFLRQVTKRDLNDLEFVEAESNKRPARTDHTFTWKQKSVDLGDGSLRVEVEVDGDQVAGYREFVKVPEQWTRDYEKLRSRNINAQYVDEVLFVLLSMGMLILLVQRLRDRDVPARMGMGFGLVGTALFFLGQMNNFSLVKFGYETTDAYSSFLARYLLQSILAALGVGVWIFFLVASSEPIYRANFPRLQSLRRALSWQGLRTRSFFMANVVGIALTFFFFAYQTVFYLIANKLGAWAPSDVNYSDLLNTRIPWVWVLFIGFLPAVSEEMQFRAFAIPFLKKILRSWPLAIVLAAFIWGFLHSAYPNQPFFIRGVEVGLGGIVMGLIMLRFGIVATLVWHYSVDALYTAFLFLRSQNRYLMVSGAVTAGIMLIPLILALVAYWRSGTFTEEEPLTNASEGVSRFPHQEAAGELGTPLAYPPLEARRIVLAMLLAAVFLVLAQIPVERFGGGTKLRATREDAVRAAEAFLKQRDVKVAGFRTAAWLDENVDPLAVRYLLERKEVRETDRIYREATRPLLWEVRFFRPLEKEEYQVFVDVETGRVFNFRHLLDENAPGASLSSDQARALAEEFLGRQGYRLSEFDLQESKADKKKAREDYTLTYQAKAGDLRNVGDEHFRLEVSVAGDQVVGLSRYFKLPEEWVRQQSATRLSKIVLTGILALFAAGLLSGGFVLFVKQVRSGQIAWRRAAGVAALVAVAVALLELNALPTLARLYVTSIPWPSFWLSIAVGLVVVPLLLGLLAGLLVGLAASLYPDVWRVFRGSDRSVWARDAAVAVMVSLSAGAALSRLGAFVATRFHAFSPVEISLVPPGFDTAWPAAAIFLRAFRSGIFFAAILGLVIYGVRLGRTRRAWWLWLEVLLLLASLGPAGAHSLREYALGWVVAFVSLFVAIGIVAAFFRDNILAYIAAAFCLPLAEPLMVLLSEPAGFFRWNGIALGGLALVVLVWLLVPVGASSPEAA